MCDLTSFGSPTLFGLQPHHRSAAALRASLSFRGGTSIPHSPSLHHFPPLPAPESEARQRLCVLWLGSRQLNYGKMYRCLALSRFITTTVLVVSRGPDAGKYEILSGPTPPRSSADRHRTNHKGYFMRILGVQEPAQRMLFSERSRTRRQLHSFRMIVHRFRLCPLSYLAHRRLRQKNPTGRTLACLLHILCLPVVLCPVY